MTQAGFGEVTSLPGLIGPSGGEGQIGLFARKAWQQPATAAAPVETPAEKSWLIFADASGLGGQLATQLRAAGAHCRIARPGKQFAATGADTFTLRAEAPEDWTQLLAACATAAPVERIIYLWGLDAPAEVADSLMGTDALLHLSQALEATNPGYVPILVAGMNQNAPTAISDRPAMMPPL